MSSFHRRPWTLTASLTSFPPSLPPSLPSTQNQERGVEGLRQEVRESEAALDTAKAQHSAWMRQAQRREAECVGREGGREEGEDGQGSSTKGKCCHVEACNDEGREGWQRRAVTKLGGGVPQGGGRREAQRAGRRAEVTFISHALGRCTHV
jgi:hypothetical protein